MVDSVFSTIETRVRLLRYLQGGENPTADVQRTREDIADDFGVSINTLGEHLQTLRYGCDILGSNVNLDVRRGENNYDSTVHPFFLALNLSEVYLLMIIIRRMVEDLPIKNSYQNILADMYRQLSPYAKQKIDSFADRENVKVLDGKKASDFVRGYRNETAGDLITLIKHGKTCRIQFSSEINKVRRGCFGASGGLSQLEFIDNDTGERISIDDDMQDFYYIDVDEQ